MVLNETDGGKRVQLFRHLHRQSVVLVKRHRRPQHHSGQHQERTDREPPEGRLQQERSRALHERPNATGHIHEVRRHKGQHGHGKQGRVPHVSQGGKSQEGKNGDFPEGTPPLCGDERQHADRHQDEHRAVVPSQSDRVPFLNFRAGPKNTGNQPSEKITTPWIQPQRIHRHARTQPQSKENGS